MSNTGIVFKIQRHSLHDGPGIRTVVFLKGCPLHCIWCFNPESQKSCSEVLHYHEKCIGCNRCLSVCTNKNALKNEFGDAKLDKALCDNCGTCVGVCPTSAMVYMGTEMSSEQVVNEVLKDRVFYKERGGVTLSGGEVTSQKDFAVSILRGCREKGINTAIETCGYTSWDSMSLILEHVDLVLYDIKVLDSRKHKEFTGVDNALILDNAVRISKNKIPLIIRIPVIPGCNDGDDDMKSIADFISSRLINIKSVHLLPYELMGVNKYKRLSREYCLMDAKPPDEQKMEYLKGIFDTYGLNVQIGG